MRIYSRYDVGPKVFARADGKCVVQQHLVADADINSIMERYRVTGVLDERPGAVYGDVSDVKDLAESLEKIREIEAMFASLPAKVRESMANDWRNLEIWIADEANAEMAEKLGWKDSAVTPLDVTVLTDTKKAGEDEKEVNV